MTQHYQGKLTIRRLYGTTDTEMMQISLVDEHSLTQCVAISCTIQALMEALINEADRPCTFEWRPDNVGKRLEHKEEVVPYDGYHQRGSTMEQLAKQTALEPFEHDGWQGRASDVGNLNRYAGNNRFSVAQYRVLFTRYVDASD